MPSHHRPMSGRTRMRVVSATALTGMFLAGPLASAAHAVAEVPPLGTASAFSVLAGSTVTNTGPTTIDRSVGVHPGSAVTGESTMTVGGTTHKADAVALQAKNDLTNAYNQAAGQTIPIAQDDELGGETKVGGIYKHPSAMGLTGELTLDGANNPDSIWVFQAGSTLITASGASVTLINQANPCNVFWQVSSSATIGTTTDFVGTIMAEATITMQTGATILGRTLARSGAVNLDSNVFTSPNCGFDEDVYDAVDDTDDTDGTDGTGGTDGTTGGTDGTGGTEGGTGSTTDGTTDGTDGGTGGTTGIDGGTGNASDEVQVKKTPTGAVDTGRAGAAASDDTFLSGWVLAAGFGGLALVALRRRQLM